MKSTTLFTCSSCGAQKKSRVEIELNKSRAEIKAGKGKILKSLKDLR